VPGHALAQRPADNLPAEQVDNHSEVQPALTGVDISDIAGPNLIRLLKLEVAV
jgi:hypothetical protein